MLNIVAYPSFIHSQGIPLWSGDQKKSDVIYPGRIAVDPDGQLTGACLEDISTFSNASGGSSGNAAYGTAIQGLRSGMQAIALRLTRKPVFDPDLHSGPFSKKSFFW